MDYFGTERATRISIWLILGVIAILLMTVFYREFMNECILSGHAPGYCQFEFWK